MKKKWWIALAIVLVGALAATVYATVFNVPNWGTEHYLVELVAHVQENPAQITLEWPSDTAATKFDIYRRTSITTPWGTPVQSLSGTSTTYVDTNVAVGVKYEYRVIKYETYCTQGGDGYNQGFNPLSPAFGYGSGACGSGYILSGIKVPYISNRGTMIFLVENSIDANLPTQVAQAKNDLISDGWNVIQHNVASTSSVVTVKALVVADYNADPSHVKGVYILGHVPVPRSGLFTASGELYVDGAYSADSFYADIDGVWTDTADGSSFQDEYGVVLPRYKNIPGDGKYDQVDIPSLAELGVGRVDLYDMPAFLPRTEIDLTRQYLQKDHDYKIASSVPPVNALVDDQYGEFGGEAFSNNGTRNFAPIVGGNNITLTPCFYPSNCPFFAQVTSNQYLFTDVVAGGYFTGQWGVGSTADYAASSTYGVFNMKLGSLFDDFDATDNFLRAPLASAGTGLTSMWGARPDRYIQRMGLGESIGDQELLNQNNTYAYVGIGYTPVDIFPGNVNLALLGDPSLRLYMTKPAGTATIATSTGSTTISWGASSDTNLVGYDIYRSTAPSGPFYRINPSLLSTRSYTDHPSVSGSYVYMVRAVALYTSASGSFYNPAIGTTTPLVTVTGAGPDLPSVTTDTIISSSTLTSFVASGFLYDTGAQTVTARGFRYGTSTSYGLSTSTTGSFSAGQFSLVLSHFKCDHDYHIQAFATNASGTAYGEDRVIHTIECAAGITFTNVHGKVGTSAIVEASITGNGINTDIVERGVQYGLTSSYGSVAKDLSADGFVAGPFRERLDGLTCGSTYYVRSYMVLSDTSVLYASPSSFVACSDTFRSLKNGVWTDPAVWRAASDPLCTTTCVAGADYPGGGDNAIVVSYTVTLGADQSAKNMTVETDGQLDLAGHTLTVLGDWLNQGTFTANAGSVVFGSGATQSISGTNIFYNLVKNSTSPSGLTFDTVHTTTVTHELSLSGAAGAPLSIVNGPGGLNFDLSIAHSFDYAAGVAVDSHGNIYVGDCGSSVQKFDSSGNFIGYIGSSSGGPAEGQFNCPQYITVDSNDNIYIPDWGGNRIQEFDSSGTFVKMFGWGVATGASQFEICTAACHIGLSGSGVGQIYHPNVAAVDATGNIYVGDGNNRIEKFDSNGNFISMWGDGVQDGSAEFQICTSGCRGGLGGTIAGAVQYPYMISISPTTGHVYVTDEGLNRVNIYDQNGNFISTFGWGVATGASQFESCTANCQSGIGGVGDGQFNSPTGMAIDAAGHIYVGDYGANYPNSANGGRVQIFDAEGNLLSIVRSATAGQGQFDYTEGLALDSHGNLYFAVWNSAASDQTQIYRYNLSGNTFTLSAPQGTSVSHIDVQHSNAISPITCISCSDLGGNTNWFFVADPSFSNVSSGGSSGGGSISPAALQALFAPGTTTTAYLNSLKKLAAPVSTTPASLSSTVVFTRDLSVGAQGGDVKALQVYLNTHGFVIAKTGAGSPGHETNLLGALTQKALAKYQKAHSLFPTVGFFGPKTRAFIKNN